MGKTAKRRARLLSPAERETLRAYHPQIQQVVARARADGHTRTQTLVEEVHARAGGGDTDHARLEGLTHLSGRVRTGDVGQDNVVSDRRWVPHAGGSYTLSASLTAYLSGDAGVERQALSRLKLTLPTGWEIIEALYMDANPPTQQELATRLGVAHNTISVLARDAAALLMVYVQEEEYRRALDAEARPHRGVHASPNA